MANLSGSLESASYAPQLGYIIRALCDAPATTADGAGKALSGAVTDKGDGLVGLPCAGHGFVQDAVVSVTGSANYDGTYRVAPGVTADEVVIEAPYKAETLAGATLHRGRVCVLSGAAKTLSGGKVALPVEGHPCPERRGKNHHFRLHKLRRNARPARRDGKRAARHHREFHRRDV